MDAAVRWAPTSTSSQQQFLYVDIATQAVRLCEVEDDLAQRPLVAHHVVYQYARLPRFLAFDWRAQESLVVTGWPTGEAAIYRLQEAEEAPVVFPVRSQRYCNTVAFSAQLLLASGLDKVRTDFCLNVWDVNQKLAASDVRRARAAEPLRKLSSEPVASIKFFGDRPDTLLAGIKGQCVRLYDLRDGSGSPALQFAPTQCVNSIAINPLDENYFASCNPAGGGQIQIWDRRAGGRAGSAAAAGGWGPGYSPVNLSAVPDGQQHQSYQVSGAALTYDRATEPKASIWSLRWSPTKRGTLAMLASDGTFKAFEVGQEYVSSADPLTSVEGAVGTIALDDTFPRPIYTRHTRQIQHPFSCSDRQRANDDSARIAAFDWVNLGCSNEAHAVTVLRDKTVALTSLPRSYRPVCMSSQGSLAMASTPRNDNPFTTIEPSMSVPSALASVSDEIQAIRQRATRGHRLTTGSNTPSRPASRHTDPLLPPTPYPAVRIPLSHREKRERSRFAGIWGSQLHASDALTWLTIPKYRCKEGYLPTGPRNREIVADDPGLVELWDWIDRARARSAGKSMVIHNIDLNYLGVFSIWNNRLGGSLASRILSGVSNRSIDVESLIQDLAEEMEIPPTKVWPTERLAHRQLCLRTAGAIETREELQKTVAALVDERQHTKAAALALFQDEPKLAYQALMKNHPTQAHRLLAMAIIGGGATGVQSDPDWEETCAEIACELTDPFSRAILALVSKGDWASVVDEKTLPLRYRVEVALRWLSDEELTLWVRETTSESIVRGDIEGVLLTGLDHAAMDLFQSYIRRFDDVQTAVLAMSHTVPRFISDADNRARFDAWRETYRRQIASWQAHLLRVKFDVESRRLATVWGGRQLIPPQAQQISLVCNYCTKPLAQ
ncbi:hypothetical protein KEM52_006405, partial [Ascosphaera acerosa]